MIKIAMKFRPFTHLVGAKCLLPGTDSIIQAFPTLIRVGKKEIPLSVTGPVKGFTLEQDLEQDRVRVYGKSHEGHFCHTFESDNKMPTFERLSFGVHKQLDWEMVIRRGDLLEILPLLFVLGQKVPKGQIESFYSTLEEFENVIQAGFKDLLIPVRKDERHLGISIDEIDPLLRLRKCYESIRRLFIFEDEKKVHILPNLLKPFHAGRMTGLNFQGGQIDLEWTKRKIRRVQLFTAQEGEIFFSWPKEIKKFRIRSGLRERGSSVDSSSPIVVEPGKRYLLDKFEK